MNAVSFPNEIVNVGCRLENSKYNQKGVKMDEKLTKSFCI